MCKIASNLENSTLQKACVASRSEITPCIKIDKPLVVYRFSLTCNRNVIKQRRVFMAKSRRFDFQTHFKGHMKKKLFLRAPVLSNLLNALHKSDKMLVKPRISSSLASPTGLINSITHEHSC